METKYANAAKAAFRKAAADKVHQIVNIFWAWTVPTGVSDLAKMIDAAIQLGGLDSQTTREFTQEEVEKLGKELEMFRRLEMKAETEEVLLAALADHGIVISATSAAD